MSTGKYRIGTRQCIADFVPDSTRRVYVRQPLLVRETGNGGDVGWGGVGAHGRCSGCSAWLAARIRRDPPHTASGGVRGPDRPSRRDHGASPRSGTTGLRRSCGIHEHLPGGGWSIWTQPLPRRRPRSATTWLPPANAAPSPGGAGAGRACRGTGGPGPRAVRRHARSNQCRMHVLTALTSVSVARSAFPSRFTPAGPNRRYLPSGPACKDVPPWCPGPSPATAR